MPRYVILTHDWPFPHWDLMLEEEQSLATWRLLSAPGSSRTVSAERLVPHRLDYLDYQGPLSGDRGTVAQWDGGEYETLARDETLWEVRLAGHQGLQRATIRSGTSAVEVAFD